VRVGYRDESFGTVGWPFSTVTVTDDGGLVVGTVRRREIPSNDIARVIRCGLLVRWALRIVPRSGDRIVLWAPRLPARIPVALRTQLEDEPRRTMIMWQRRSDDVGGSNR
jgi:hypothetical protein